MSPSRWLRLARVAAVCMLLGTPVAARADVVSLFYAAAQWLTAAGFAVTASQLAFYVAVVAVNVYGGMDARRRAAHAQADATRAYNAGLADRMATVLSADPPLRVIYGQCRAGGDIAAIFSSDKTAIRTDGTSYTKPDGLKHLVIVLAAHEVEDIVEMYLDGVAVGSTDATGWAQGGDAAKVQTYVRAFTLAAGASQTFGGPVTVIDTHDAAGYLVSASDNGPAYFTGAATTYTVTGGNTVTNTSSIAASVSLSYTASPGTVRWTKHLGTATQAADTYLLSTCPAKWTSADRLCGLAYVTVTLDLEDQRFQGGPPALTWEIKGRKVYDPRDGATRWTNNPALIVRDYLLARWGLECVAGDVDDAYTIAAANACAAVVTFSTMPDGGGAAATVTEATYTCNGALTSGDNRERMLDGLCEAMGGFAVYGARWQIIAGAWTIPVLSLGDNDLAGQVELVQAGTALDDAFNGIRGSYVAAGLGVASDYSYANATLVAADGRELWTDTTLPFTNSAARARNLARVLVERNRDGQVIRFPAKLNAWPLQVGDRVMVTNTEYGLSAKAYRVTDWQFGLASPVVLTLQEDAAAIYDQADAATADPAPNTGLPNPWAVAAVTGLAAASGDANLQVRSDKTINLRVKLSWTASASAYVADGSGQIEIKWRSPLARLIASSVQPGDAVDQWRTVMMPGDATAGWIDGLIPAEAITVAVTAINGLGVRSAAAVIGHTVVGHTAVPDNVAGLAATVVQGGVQLAWSASAEPLYAATELRTGASWAAGTRIYRGAARPFVWLSPAAGTYTVWAKHFDSTGLESAAAASISVVVDAAMLVQWAALSGKPANLASLTGAEGINNALVSISAGGSLQGAGGGQVQLPQLPGALVRSQLEIELGKTVDLIPPINAATGKLDTSLTTLAQAVMQLGLKASAVDGVLRDAGIAVDPNSGLVTISAVQAAQRQVNNVQVQLDAANATITSKASVTYVNSTVAAAALNPAALADITGLSTRVTTAETSISGLTATVSAKADSTTVTGQDARLTTAETNISGLTGTVATKAASTVTDGLNTRLTTAEGGITALGDQASAVQDLKAGAYRLDNTDSAAAATSLQALLALWQTTQAVNTALAVAHEELTAKINGDVSAEASLRLLLAARVAGAEAAIVVEQLVRASADAAAASSITTLQARLAGTGDVGSAIASVQTQASATASSVTGLSSQYALKVQTVRSDGKVVLGAIGLASTSNTSGSQSEIILSADKLTFVPSSNPNAATQPLLTTGMVNGVAALIIGAAVIGDATIQTLHLASGAVSANVNASNSLSIPSLPNSSSTYTTSAIAAGSLTASGGYVSAQATVSVRAHAGSSSVASVQIFAKLYRNGTQVGASTWFGRAAQYPDPVGTGQAVAAEFTLTHPLLTLTGAQVYTVDIAIQFRDSSGLQINPYNASVTSYLQVDVVCNLQEIKV